MLIVTVKVQLVKVSYKTQTHIVINQIMHLESFQITGSDDDEEDIANTDTASRNVVMLNSIQHGDHAIEGNCWHHLRAVWVNAASKDIARHVSRDLSSELREIDARLRVKVKMDAIILAMDKCFAVTANYPKGCGDAFQAHMEERHSDHILHHVPSTKGNRQDIVCMCAGPAYMNRPYYIEFLDKKLRACNKQSMLQENMFIILSSVSIATMFRLFSIMEIAIIMPMRWFAGNSDKLANYGWSLQSMGRLLDTLYESMNHLKEEP